MIVAHYGISWTEATTVLTNAEAVILLDLIHRQQQNQQQKGPRV